MPSAVCPRCGAVCPLPDRPVSKTACPKCKAVFAVPPEKPLGQLPASGGVELTAKKWKAIQLAGGALILPGLLLAWLSTQFPKAAALWDAGKLFLIGGILVYGAGRTLAWWHHG